MMKNNRRAFTLFELLAVLTVSGVLFMVILGSYNSWAAVHACNGTARVIKAGLHQAQTLARAKNRYTIFEFSSIATNQVQRISQQSLYLCTNTTADTEQRLDTINFEDSLDAQLNALDDIVGITPAAPVQQLSGHVRLTASDDPSSSEDDGVILFFRPDGSVWNGVPDSRYHYIAIYSRQLFDGTPLARFLRIELTTGAVELLREENIR
jgi:prepilin-type N-terminal cleavage/methylation domain-containing protein